MARNVALVAQAPKQRSLQRVEGISLTDEELRQLMRAAAGHRFFPIYWLTAMTGMRRNEVLGLKWTDIDLKKKRIHLNRGLVAVGYEVHQTRGKTKTARLSDTAEVNTFWNLGYSDPYVLQDDGVPITWTELNSRVAWRTRLHIIRFRLWTAVMISAA